MGSWGTGERAELGAWPGGGRKAQGEAAGSRDQGQRGRESPSCTRPSSLGFPSSLYPFQTRGTINIFFFPKHRAVIACRALF